MELIVHIACIVGLAAALVAGAAWMGGLDPSLLRQYRVGEASGAASIVGDELPAYIFLVNAHLHPDAGERAAWIAYLAGDEAAPVTGSATCVTFAGDAGTLDLALHLAAGLAPGQLELKADDAFLAISKAEHGSFDILAMTEEAAAIVDISALAADPQVEVVWR